MNLDLLYLGGGSRGGGEGAGESLGLLHVGGVVEVNLSHQHSRVQNGTGTLDMVYTGTEWRQWNVYETVSVLTFQTAWW